MASKREDNYGVSKKELATGKQDLEIVEGKVRDREREWTTTAAKA